MNTQQLLCFVCAADHLNFTKTAEELYLSAPTVTHHIKNLENELNTLLFIRTSKMVKLTEAGQQFYTDAKDILSRIDIAEKKIQKIAQKDISFYARFNGQDEFIVIPYNAMLDLIAVENEIRYPLEMWLTPDPEDEEGEQEESDDNDNVVGFSTVDDSTDETDEQKDEGEKKDSGPSFTILKDD